MLPYIPRVQAKKLSSKIYAYPRFSLKSYMIMYDRGYSPKNIGDNIFDYAPKSNIFR